MAGGWIGAQCAPSLCVMSDLIRLRAPFLASCGLSTTLATTSPSRPWICSKSTNPPSSRFEFSKFSTYDVPALLDLKIEPYSVPDCAFVVTCKKTAPDAPDSTVNACCLLTWTLAGSLAVAQSSPSIETCAFSSSCGICVVATQYP